MLFMQKTCGCSLICFPLSNVSHMLLGEKTKNLIGTSETLTATAMAGGFYSLFAAQPLIPIGPTGPLLVFDEILFTVRNKN